MSKVQIRTRSGRFNVDSDYFRDSGLELLCVRLERQHHPLKGKNDEVTKLLREGFIRSRDTVFPIGTGFTNTPDRIAFWEDVRNRPDALFSWGLEHA